MAIDCWPLRSVEGRRLSTVARIALSPTAAACRRCSWRSWLPTPDCRTQVRRSFSECLRRTVPHICNACTCASSASGCWQVWQRVWSETNLEYDERCVKGNWTNVDGRVAEKRRNTSNASPVGRIQASPANKFPHPSWWDCILSPLERSIYKKKQKTKKNINNIYLDLTALTGFSSTCIRLPDYRSDWNKLNPIFALILW